MIAHVIDSFGVWLRSVEVDPEGPQPDFAIYSDIIPPKEGFSRVYNFASGFWEYAAPALIPTVTVTAPKQISALDMLDLFTEDEQRAVVAASLQNVEIKLWYDRMIAASYVTYGDPRTAQGLDALVSAGLLTQPRRDEIIQALQ